MLYLRLIFCLQFLVLGCSVNILEEFADKTTDQALLYEARMLINDRNYAEAVATFDSMTPEYLARRDVKGLRASAYAGVCGIEFLDLLEDIGAIGTTRIFVWLMDSIRGGTLAKQTACVQAETIIKSIATLGVNRTADENLLMAFIAIGKMGTIISRYGDSGTPDGTVDAGFDPCDSTDLPSADAKQIATGFNIARDALANIGSSTVGSDITSDVTTICASMPAGPDALCANPAQVATTDIDATEEQAIRTMLNEDQDIGLGVCAGDATTCLCP